MKKLLIVITILLLVLGVYFASGCGNGGVDVSQVPKTTSTPTITPTPGPSLTPTDGPSPIPSVHFKAGEIY